MSSLGARIDEIDVQVEKIHQLIERSTADDPEMGAGAGTSTSLSVVQRNIDQAAASCEALDDHIRKIVRGGLSVV
ncbi:MAG: hypothetical protein ABIQ18_31990 [Umezawaea sp.]